MKKKICIITSSYPANKNDSRNAGVFVRDFALSLSEKEVEVFILTPRIPNCINEDLDLKVNYFPWFSSDLGLSSHNLKNPIHFIKLLSVVVSGLIFSIKFFKKNKPDYCIAMWAVPSGIFSMFGKILFGTPYFVWALGSDIWKINNFPLGKYILKKILRNASFLFADGLSLSKEVERISSKKCEFLSSSRKLRTELIPINYNNFDPNKINFMFLGRYHESKGVDLLIEAINDLSPKDKEKSAFHLFGGGPLKQKITKMVNLNSKIFINDYLDANEVFSYMSKMDFLIIPSRSESIPVVLSESIQVGIPLIVTDVGDMGSIVSKFNLGYVVNPTIQDLSIGISKAIQTNDNQFKISSTNLERLREYFDLESSVKKIVKILDEVRN